MTEFSSDSSSSARKIDTSLRKIDSMACKSERLILQRLASVGQACIAKHIGVNESTISRWKDEEFLRWSKILALLGLKIVPIDAHVYQEKMASALYTLASYALETAGCHQNFIEKEG